MIDWQLLTLMLRSHAPLSDIERKIGVARGSINRIARGEACEPPFSVGLELLNIAYDVLPEHDFMRARKCQ